MSEKPYLCIMGGRGGLRCVDLPEDEEWNGARARLLE